MKTREMILSIFKATFPERFVWPLFLPRVRRLFIYLLKSFEWDRAGWENLIFWQHPNTQRRAVLPVLHGRGESSSTRKTTNAWILCLGYSRSRAVKGIRGRSNWIHGVAMGKLRRMWCISSQALSWDEICSRAVDRITPMTRFTEKHVLIFGGSLWQTVMPLISLLNMQFWKWAVPRAVNTVTVDTVDLQLIYNSTIHGNDKKLTSPWWPWANGQLVFLAAPAC